MFKGALLLTKDYKKLLLKLVKEPLMEEGIRNSKNHNKFLQYT